MDEYQTFAGVYDSLLYPFLHSIRVKTTRVALDLKPESIIDICCGTGNQLKYLRNQGFKNVKGIDISVSMLNQSQKGDDTVNCSQGDAAAMDIADNSYDMGIISFALHEKPKEIAENIVKEAFRIIREGGHLVVVDYAPDGSVNPFIKMMVHTVERMAGKEHYRYFKKYRQFGGMNTLLPTKSLMEEYRFHSGATRLRVYKIHRNSN